jgi:hypothetical protein
MTAAIASDMAANNPGKTFGGYSLHRARRGIAPARRDAITNPDSFLRFDWLKLYQEKLL